MKEVKTTAGRAWGAVEQARACLNGPKRRDYKPGSNRMLIAVSYWSADAAAAEKMTRFLADLEPVHTERADILLAHRFDCPAPSAGWVGAVSRKFNTFVHQSDKCLTGWPQGCNGTWASMIKWLTRSISSGACPPYKFVFCAEADGAPYIQNWIEDMSSEWDRLDAKKPTYQAGPLVNFPAQHINGNCLLSCDPKFMDWLNNTASGSVLRGGWDYVLARQFRMWGWANIERMRSYYNTAKFSVGDYLRMRNEKLMWVHGDKGGCLIEFGRQVILKEKYGNV